MSDPKFPTIDERWKNEAEGGEGLRVIDDATARAISVEEIYAQVQITPTGSTRWGDDVPSRSSGVYVISTECLASIPRLPDKERAFWVPNQVIVYIGRAKQLRRRLREFRKHVYGNSSPHSGGQAILLLDCAKTITWAEVEDYSAAEDALIEAFRAHVGQRPFGNRVRSAKLVKPEEGPT